jgi:hypothetical protein
VLTWAPRVVALLAGLGRPAGMSPLLEHPGKSSVDAFDDSASPGCSTRGGTRSRSPLQSFLRAQAVYDRAGAVREEWLDYSLAV